MPDADSPSAPLRNGNHSLFVLSAKKCPIYAPRDVFDLEGRRLVVKEGKSVCITLASAVARALAGRAESGNIRDEDPLHIECAGCEGTVSVLCTAVSGQFGDLDQEQRRKVQHLVETLGRFSLFSMLNEEELRKVIPEMKAGDFRTGEIVIRQGERTRYLYVVESGAVDVLSGQNDEILLTTLKQGEIFGEMSLLSGTPCSATIRVREESRLLAVDGALFARMVVRYPSLQLYLFRLLTHRLRETNALKETQLAKGIRGSLDDLQLGELLQALHLARKSGRLRLNLPKGQAELFLRGGRLASIAYGNRTDAECFFELLKESTGTFSFTPESSRDPSQGPEIGDLMALLLEGLVRMDESAS